MLSARKRKPSGSSGPSDGEAAPGDDTPGGEGGGDAQPEVTVAPMHPPHSKSPLVMGGIGALLIIVLIVGLGKSDAQQILLHKISSSTHETLLHTPQQQLARSAPVTQQLDQRRDTAAAVDFRQSVVWRLEVRGSTAHSAAGRRHAVRTARTVSVQQRLSITRRRRVAIAHDRRRRLAVSDVRRWLIASRVIQAHEPATERHVRLRLAARAGAA